MMQFNGCEHINKIQTKGEILGTRNSSQPFVKGKHNVSASYPLNEEMNIIGRVSHPYISEHSVDAGLPDYGEVGLELLF